MLSLTQIEPPILFPRPNVLTDGLGSSPLQRFTDQPDPRRNPRPWLKLYLEGLTLHRRSLALARRAERVLDLGCGCGWFSIAVAQGNPDVRVEGVDTDGRLLDWARYYSDRLQNEGKKFGQVTFTEQNVEEYPWAEVEEQFDVIHAGFILSRCKDPGEVLNGIYKALKPGGWLIYHDATEPPSGNLDQAAVLQHRWVKWRDPSSDPWSWRRVWKQRYRFDMVRALARHSDPTEGHVLARVEELFALRFQERRRAFLDVYLRMARRKPNQKFLMLPVVKFLDDFGTRMGIVQGACRYVLAQKR